MELSTADLWNEGPLAEPHIRKGSRCHSSSCSVGKDALLLSGVSLAEDAPITSINTLHPETQIAMPVRAHMAEVALATAFN